MTTTIPRLTTRSIRTAEHIRDRKAFTTSGSLSGRVLPDGGLGYWDSGRLRGPDEDRFRQDCGGITYVVWSYATPIAWYTEGRGWHVVEQKFSLTTTKHQGNLYLIPRESAR